MELSLDEQAGVLDYLSDKELLDIAGPRGLGVDAFNRFYRWVQVLDYDEDSNFNLSVGTPDFNVSVARHMLSAQQYVKFCKRHPYFRPQTVEFNQLAVYLEVLSLAPETLAAASVELSFCVDMHPQLAAPAGPHEPGLLANISRYSCESAARFETVAENLWQLLPQLEVLSFRYTKRGPWGMDVDTHRCDFEHPKLRRLTLSGPNEDLMHIDIVRLPAGLQALVSSQVMLVFNERFDFAASALTMLRPWPQGSLEFPAGKGPTLLPQFTRLELPVFGGEGGYDATLVSPQLRSLSMDCVLHDTFLASTFTKTLTSVRLMFNAHASRGHEIEFHNVFPVLRSLVLGFDDFDRSGTIRICGRFPKTLERINLSRTTLASPETDLEQLHRLESLSLDECSFQWLILPPQLNTLALHDCSGKRAVEFNPGLKWLSLTVMYGHQYHQFPDLDTLNLRYPRDGHWFVATPDTITLPSTLTSLDVGSIDASRLKLPPSLVNLRMSASGLTEFPALPRLESLNVSDNQIKLPQTLPPSLQSLDVTGNIFPAYLDWSASNLRTLVAVRTKTKILLPPTTEVVATMDSESFEGGSPDLEFAYEC